MKYLNYVFIFLYISNEIQGRPHEGQLREHEGQFQEYEGQSQGQKSLDKGRLEELLNDHPRQIPNDVYEQYFNDPSKRFVRDEEGN